MNNRIGIVKNTKGSDGDYFSVRIFSSSSSQSWLRAQEIRVSFDIYTYTSWLECKLQSNFFFLFLKLYHISLILAILHSFIKLQYRDYIPF